MGFASVYVCILSVCLIFIVGGTELVRGYGVFLMQRQLDAAVVASKESPTRLIRNLMSAFFAPDVLAVSSACSTRKH